MSDETRKYVELVGDKTEVTVKLTVGQLVAVNGILNAEGTHTAAMVQAIAAGMVKPGAREESLLDYCNVLVALHDALAKSQGMKDLHGGARAIIDQAEAFVRDHRREAA